MNLRSLLNILQLVFSPLQKVFPHHTCISHLMPNFVEVEAEAYAYFDAKDRKDRV